ncbi:DUF3311 domain-containing protein [Streptomyces sp. CT34]|uniref:DUF3311 domain-containing protein n=1 Tax=Streptomyces sp. CT34 TaxID=1553907 RepID=UPI00099CF235|nr:DUF3311 domain-containing protein [Streptomyces sp. CT34]
MAQRTGKAQRTGAAWWLLVPYVLFLAVLPLVNRVVPTVAGLPFLFFWMLLATLLTPVAVWLAHRGGLRRARSQAPGPADERGRG